MDLRSRLAYYRSLNGSCDLRRQILAQPDLYPFTLQLKLGEPVGGYQFHQITQLFQI